MINLNCNNKGCGKVVAATLDLTTNQVICPECKKEITNITNFTKHQLKSLGQVIKKNKCELAWALTCPTCNVRMQPSIKSKKIYCSKCDDCLDGKIATAYEHAIKLNHR